MAANLDTPSTRAGRAVPAGSCRSRACWSVRTALPQPGRQSCWLGARGSREGIESHHDLPLTTAGFRRLAKRQRRARQRRPGRALSDNPRYTMAQLLRQAIDSGTPRSLARIPMTPEEVAASYPAGDGVVVGNAEPEDFGHPSHGAAEELMGLSMSTPRGLNVAFWCKLFLAGITNRVSFLNPSGSTLLVIFELLGTPLNAFAVPGESHYGSYSLR